MNNSNNNNYDTIIRGGTIHSPAMSVIADIGIKGEKITAISNPDKLQPETNTQVIKAQNMDVFPGFIDVHVHLDLPVKNTVTCDDFETGSRSAASGGVTTVIDFATPGHGENLQQAHERWLEKAESKSYVDYSWHMCIVDDAHLNDIPHMIKLGLPTFKEFMIYASEGWQSDDRRIRTTLQLMKKYNAMLLLHAESPEILNPLLKQYHTPPNLQKWGMGLHTITRPNSVEAQAIKRAVNICENTGGKLYIVHMSTAEGAELVKAAQNKGVNVLAETCPQYLLLDESVFNAENPDAHLYATCPQIKKESDRLRLWQGLGYQSDLDNNSEICIVSTDTCSFTRKQKNLWNGDWTQVPMGMPGLDTLIPIMYTHGVDNNRISKNKLVELCAANPAKIMGMADRKGEILPGYDADITIIDPNHSKVATWRNLQSKCDWSPYEGMNLKGFARTTIIRGKVVVDDYKINNKYKGWGRFVKRAIF